MATRTVQIERLTVTSSKPFEAVLASVKSAIGRPNMAEFTAATQAASSFNDLEAFVQQATAPNGLMLFMELDLGWYLRRQTGADGPKIVRLIVGNPLIMKEMARHVPDAGSYAPVTILVDQRPDGVHLTYDTMASLLAPYGSEAALAVARDLDAKVERILQASAS